MTTPTWAAAVTGQNTAAGAVNQFLGTHQTSWIYTGASILSVSGSAGTSLSTLGQYIDQPFTQPAGKTTIGYITVGYTITGTAPDVTFTVQTDNGSGRPSGTILATIVVPADFWTAFSGTGIMPIPVALTGLTAGATYHLVSQPAGTAGNVINLTTISTVSTGWAALGTSTNGTTWAAGTGTLNAAVYAGNTGALYLILEDSGARWQILTAGSPSPLIGQIAEYTVGSSSQTRSVRTLSYSSGLLTGAN